jgi:SNF2 family DNA or RNA helicase
MHHPLIDEQPAARLTQAQDPSSDHHRSSIEPDVPAAPEDDTPRRVEPASTVRQATWHDGALWVWGTVSDGQALRLRLPDGEAQIPAMPRTGTGMLELLEADPAHDDADSLACLRTLSRFARAAVAREQFYPSARRTPAGVVGSWRLLVGDPADVERLEAFAASMPGACFCADEGFAPVDRLELIESFLDACCDAYVRRSLAKDEFFSNVHDRAADPSADAEVRWVSALVREPDEVARDNSLRAVRGIDREVATLLNRVQQWTARLGDSGGEPWRLGFVLSEPEHEADPWPLSFRLLPPAELSGEHAPVMAEQVWEQPAGSIGYLGRNAVRLRERLAAELARAAEVLPPLERLIGQPEPIDQARPGGIGLEATEAFGLMRDWAELLREAGYDVQLPAWAQARENKLEVVMDLKPADGTEAVWRGAGTVGLDALLSFDWRVAVGGGAVDMGEFRRLVAEGRPLIKRNNVWVEVDLDAAAAAAELIDRHPPGTLTLGEAFRAGFGLGEFAASNGSAPAIRLAGAEWVEQLLDQMPKKAAESVPQPEAFDGQLRPYQLRGLQWLAFLDALGLGGVLADDMGLGKTIQLIALLQHERTNSTDLRPTLLFVPTSVLGNWARELKRFAPELKVLSHHGPARLKGEAFIEAASAVDVVITSYALSHRDRDDLSSVGWRRVALDEAQKIKNPQSASSEAVRAVPASRRVALTGTPVENHLGELWSIMDLLNPGLLGTQAEFRERFSVPIEKQGDRGRARRLREMIRPFVLRRTKDEPEVAADLPAKMEMSVFCGLTGEQAAIYERITQDMLGRIDTATGIRRRGLILSVLTKLKQVCNHPALLADAPPGPTTLTRSGKATRLAEMLEEVIEEGERALVFTQYRKMGDLLVPMLEQKLGREVIFLHGGTPQHKREEMVLRFQDETDMTRPPVFLLSLRAGGLGLNLTAASHVFHYDRWWNPAVENQATDRAHRIGQTRRVQVHKFVTIGTVEERIDRMLAEKSALAQNIVGSGDEWLTELSTGELREYLSLSRDQSDAAVDAAGFDHTFDDDAEAP